MLLVINKILYSNELKKIDLKVNSKVLIIGNGTASRMNHYNHFESLLHLYFPDKRLYIRNIGDEGNTPGFRPHSGRHNQLGFPEAEKFISAYNDGNNLKGNGHFKTENEWIDEIKPDVLLMFFGFNEAFYGNAGLKNFKNELNGFLNYISSKKYNENQEVVKVLISPTGYDNLSDKIDVPNGIKENNNIEKYVKVMSEVAKKNNVMFLDVFSPSKEWFKNSKEDLTIDGVILNSNGHKKLSEFIIENCFKNSSSILNTNRNNVYQAVADKNWYWRNYYKIPNGVHVFGRRYKPYGNINYPEELIKLKQMISNRDKQIWAVLKDENVDLINLDSKTLPLTKIESNYKTKSKKHGSLNFLKGKKALKKITVPEKFKITQWATEQEFPDLANPAQMTFDNKGRLWVAVMPSYPHYRAGDLKPNDKLIILEDKDGDGKADSQKIWADNLHLPIGFEITEHGVIVSQGTSIILLKDNDGDDYAEYREILYSGFDDHDTHHAISSFTSDPSGAIIFCEGNFLRSNIETPYGTIRTTEGGFFRYNHARRHLERVAQVKASNPWGITFDNWGQSFFLQTSGPGMHWMLPSSVKPRYGIQNTLSKDLIEMEQKVRPTSGMEILYSRHFPDEFQGDVLINNTIGFLGTKQHALVDDGSGYKTFHRQDLISSTDGNFRPVDIEVAPDGSLFVIDWHNPLVGHMQHSARDPNRDKKHGRVYRITYPSRPLIKPAKIDGASIDTLLENLKLHEYRSRYRTRRELRSRDPELVIKKLKNWMNNLDKDNPKYEQYLLESLWVTWGINNIDVELLKRLSKSTNLKVRAASIRALRHNFSKIENFYEILEDATKDKNGRVLLEVITAASWIDPVKGNKILESIKKNNKNMIENDVWLIETFKNAYMHLNNKNYVKPKLHRVKNNLKGEFSKSYERGMKIYNREGYCSTCHQQNGEGLPLAGFPPLSKTEWVNGSPERLIKITLKGLEGPISVNGKDYSGQITMPPFGSILNDEEVADILTFIRNSFGNQSDPITAEQVNIIRKKINNRNDSYTAIELLKN